MMKAIAKCTSFELQPGEAMSIASSRRQCLQVSGIEGKRLWITRKGDLRDFWIGSGDRFVLAPGDEITLSLEGGSASAKILAASTQLTAWRPRGTAHHLLPSLLLEFARYLAAPVLPPRRPRVIVL